VSKAFAWLSFALAVGVLAVWLAQGRPLVTMTERPVTQKVVDEFGDTMEKHSWEPDLRIGLLDVTLPVVAVFGALGTVLLVRARRASREVAAKERA